MASSVKPLLPNSFAHVRHAWCSISYYEEEPTLAEFWEKLGYSAEDFNDHDLNDHWCPKEDFESYMNKIS